eukprot:CAMPEP_0175845676 /NCGR_PEP_ID=MMETSP0107_2-20121207/22355_1 /TAXON_ID=195067 ORGANISM="Goniomonas pacifica, Strain CCMP1869" /NCGR_SAMPLE_ID=MMETSP0107_2 /ASSEMBLY_ACC=CAM_ASM_000203 /LENGTH=38 /DNA_ID= /DNA_START= /DNA_END= /DNA_ORIENTATION=
MTTHGHRYVLLILLAVVELLEADLEVLACDGQAHRDRR